MTTDTMSHDQAVSSQAAERYVLGELTLAEREAFEGHYFDCGACFEQVETNAQFLGRAREVLDREPEPGWFLSMLGDLRRPAPVFVSAMLLCAAGIGVHQQMVIARSRAPHMEERVLLADSSRAATRQLNVSRQSNLSLGVDVTRKPEFVSYQVEIIDAAGKTRYSLEFSQLNGEVAAIGLPANALEAGTYSIAVQGVAKDGTKNQAGHGMFALQFTD
ncbi:MAG TPA: hypothetical protein VKL40_14735 [Candidatus Angelobacter sp.]|nr:hypothetical protein [Candidatus Angelobacter sp.]